MQIPIWSSGGNQLLMHQVSKSSSALSLQNADGPPPIAFDAPNVECLNQKHNTHVASYVKHACHTRIVEECRACSTEVVKQPVRFAEAVITGCIDKFISRTQLVLLLSFEYFRFVHFSAKRLLHFAPVRMVSGHVEVGVFLQGQERCERTIKSRAFSARPSLPATAQRSVWQSRLSQHLVTSSQTQLPAPDRIIYTIRWPIGVLLEDKIALLTTINAGRIWQPQMIAAPH
ncbi:hypothetical protein E4T43_07068 [Aureobasidium subglaciale]|nr:hypothetical protein E4T43_07068 [Aureobasidium subglaciale]